jgi:AraC-like DNA-binding protein
MCAKQSNNIYAGIKQHLFNFAQSDGGKSKRLPSLRVLAKRYGCSAPTVLRAVRDLTETNYLVPAHGGGYTTVAMDPARIVKILALLHGAGMNMSYDSYELRMKFHASYPLSMLDRNIGIYEPNLETQGQFGKLIRTRGYSGIILSCPTPAIVEETRQATSEISIPYGVFGGDDPAGDASMTFDVRKNYQKVFVELQRRNRRRILVISSANHHSNAAVQSVLELTSQLFDETAFFSGTLQETEEFALENTGGYGQNYDAVVFIMNLRNLYEKLRSQAPDCFFAMPEFSAVLEKNFRGLVMKYDLDAAGRAFAGSMDSLLMGKSPEHPHGSIACTLHEVE